MMDINSREKQMADNCPSHLSLREKEVIGE